MKRYQLLRLSLAPVLAYAVIFYANLSEVSAEPVIPTNASELLVAQSQVALATGTFVAAEQPTAGTAQIVVGEDGTRYLEFSPQFSTSEQGPDLHVLLDPAATPPQGYSMETSGRHFNLGALQSYSGAQRYPIPDVVNLADYQSVVIWCRMANATFGYAALRPTATAGVPATRPETSPQPVRGLW